MLKLLVASLKENSLKRRLRKDFTVNKGWFQHFRNHRESTNVKLSREAASVDKKAAVKFVPRFQRLGKAGVNDGCPERQPHQELTQLEMWDHEVIMKDIKIDELSR